MQTWTSGLIGSARAPDHGAVSRKKFAFFFRTERKTQVLHGVENEEDIPAASDAETF
jgi:hypothetical protein